MDKHRKSFYDIKNYRYLSASEIAEAGKNLTELKKLMLIVLIMMILIIMVIIMMLLMMINTEKLEPLKDYLKGLIEIITNQ